MSFLAGDCHTHHLDATPPALFHVEAVADLTTLPEMSLDLSIGIHPWNTGGDDIQQRLDTLCRFAGDSRIKAIGECGLDRLRGADIETQTEIFVRHVLLATTLCKPLIIHCVRAWDVLLATIKTMPSTSAPRIVHGFRGKPQLARQLLDAGLDISFGQHFNAGSYALVPQDRRHIETDDSPLTITQIRQLHLTSSTTTHHS